MDGNVWNHRTIAAYIAGTLVKVRLPLGEYYSGVTARLGTISVGQMTDLLPIGGSPAKEMIPAMQNRTGADSKKYEGFRFGMSQHVFLEMVARPEAGYYLSRLAGRMQDC